MTALAAYHEYMMNLLVRKAFSEYEIVLQKTYHPVTTSKNVVTGYYAIHANKVPKELRQLEETLGYFVTLGDARLVRKIAPMLTLQLFVFSGDDSRGLPQTIYCPAQVTLQSMRARTIPTMIDTCFEMYAEFPARNNACYVFAAIAEGGMLDNALVELESRAKRLRPQDAQKQAALGAFIQMIEIINGYQGNDATIYARCKNIAKLLPQPSVIESRITTPSNYKSADRKP